MFGGKSWTVFKVRGIPIRVDVSWMVMAAFIVWALWSGKSVVGVSDSVALALAVLSAVLFFFSILLHEGAHAAMCRARGIEVESITLFALGGYTSAQIDRRSAVEEFLVAFVGPLTSFALGLLMVGLGHTTPNADIAEVLISTGWLNVALGAFNILPAFPLDGGRVLKAVVMGASGNRRLAANVAAWSGMVAGVGLMAWGALTTVGTIHSQWGGPFMVFIGLMVLQGARGSEKREALLDLLEGATAADAMSPAPGTIPPDITLAQALDLCLRANPDVTFPVADADSGRVLGLLNLEGASTLGRQDPLKLVRDAMLPLGGELTISAQTPLGTAAGLLAKGSKLIMDGERLVGSLGLDDIVRFATARQGGDPIPASGPGPGQPDGPPIPPRPDI